jgi:hypothetical protein
VTNVAARVHLDRTQGRVPVRVTAGPVDSRLRLRVLIQRGGTWVRVGKADFPVASTSQVGLRVPIERKWRRAIDSRRVTAKVVTELTSPDGHTLRRVEGFRLFG